MQALRVSGVTGSQWAHRLTPWELAHWMGNRELKMASSAEGYIEKPGRARVRWYNVNTLRTRQGGILCSNVGLSLA